MPVEILSAAPRAEWDRFPEEIDERALAKCFAFPDFDWTESSSAAAFIRGSRSLHRSDRCAGSGSFPPYSQICPSRPR